MCVCALSVGYFGCDVIGVELGHGCHSLCEGSLLGHGELAGAAHDECAWLVRIGMVTLDWKSSDIGITCR